jgi:hypothetical protein
MVKCPQCGHQNLPSFPTCSRCGSALPGHHGAAVQLPPGTTMAPSPNDDYARLMASRAAAARRNRVAFAGAALLALVAGGVIYYRDYAQKGARQEKLDFFERWASMEKTETGAFFNCVMASEVDMNMFSSADQVQQRVESAYFTQQKTFSDLLLTDCVPKLERARQAFAGLHDPPAELAPALAKYQAVLPKLQSGIEEYAEKIKGRQGTKDLDQIIQEAGNAWHAGGSPTPEAIAFEKFMHCSIPGLARMKDAQQMLEYLADACYKKDPVVFMDHVRKDCGPLLTSVDAHAAPSKTWRLSQQRFLETDARQMQAWEGCGKRSRKGKKSEDLATFLLAVGEYMEARTDVVKAAREIKDSPAR